MAEDSGSRDSDGSWVLAGGEGLPIDTVGPEQDLASRGAEDEELEEEEEEGAQDTVPATVTSQTPSPEGTVLGVSRGAGDLSSPGGHPSPQRPHLQDPEECGDTGTAATPDGSAEHSTPDGGELAEPDAKAEPGPSPDTPKAGPPTEEGSCSSSDDDTEGLRRRQGHEPRPVPPTPAPALHRGTPDAGDEDGLSMSKYLLGALALVAVGLLVISGGIYDPADGPLESVVTRDVAAGEQESPPPADGNDSQQKPPPLDTGDPQSVQSVTLLLDKLAKENQEIRLMQAELQVGERGCALGSCLKDQVRRELAGALERARGPGGLAGLAEELSALEQRLGRELDVTGAEPFPGPWKKPFKAEKKEQKRQKRHGPGGAPHEWEKREHGKHHGHGKDPHHPREHKPGKTRGKSPHGPPQHGPRQLPPLSRYRAPQGCSGVADCARKEGREVLGAALEPVQKAQFLQLLEGFMGRLGWGGRFGGLAAQLDEVFGADGTFAHDRLRFVDFVDDVEELLEEVAREERGDEEAADGFEEYVLRHFGGDGGSAGKERGRRVMRG
ncbi:PREDICTED: pre-B-cell leukemia transcription factor-interacting protein 1 [Calidris pugnax]|uniref:pre-B-cell leukemia transcription factor-interacting protein 1 n=1 Tax=Calidris pugnax TaxID=198806 RepID=UPI00071D8BC0|nr:PREDICTED: pre-B-cell leukemia transcription factor-interacting protein 1 [Calidris pugnax]